MSDEKPHERLKDDDGDRPSGLLTWERWVAGVIGFLAAGGGGAGVFLSENQAGTTTILLLGAALLIMSIQGTPILKVGKDGAELDRKREGRRLTKQVIQAVEEKKDPEVAAELAEAARRVDPSLNRDPGFQYLSHQIYELSVHDAIRRAFRQLAADGKVQGSMLGRLRPEGDAGQADAAFTFDDDTELLLEFRYFRPNALSSRMSVAVDRMIHSLKSDKDRGLIIANVPISSEIVARAESKSQGRVRIAQWADEGDDDSLRGVLMDLLGAA